MRKFTNAIQVNRAKQKFGQKMKIMTVPDSPRFKRDRKFDLNLYKSYKQRINNFNVIFGRFQWLDAKFIIDDINRNTFHSSIITYRAALMYIHILTVYLRAHNNITG